MQIHMRPWDLQHFLGHPKLFRPEICQLSAFNYPRTAGTKKELTFSTTIQEWANKTW